MLSFHVDFQSRNLIEEACGETTFDASQALHIGDVLSVEAFLKD
jgi:hypothetical protein